MARSVVNVSPYRPARSSSRHAGDAEGRERPADDRQDVRRDSRDDAEADEQGQDQLSLRTHGCSFRVVSLQSDGPHAAATDVDGLPVAGAAKSKVTGGKLGCVFQSDICTANAGWPGASLVVITYRSGSGCGPSLIHICQSICSPRKATWLTGMPSIVSWPMKRPLTTCSMRMSYGRV